ncbi:hypothetical protein A9Q84_02875 [Halobacteriovorax marinus]|uniref:EVE domain-containing protein n=1 Tax=Halobacteriovorax marinus TaxID=97084 RepID=A0A1Y5FCR5_9BACT|nr:hypothetical protein A9Q84_02875 [Halobacteriovorax marinus]
MGKAVLNFTDEMKNGDKILLFHSSCKVPRVVSIDRVVRESFPDHIGWDKKSKYFGLKSTKENPR